MATDIPQQGESGSESSQSMGASSNPSLNGTQQQCWHQFFRLNAANAETEHMTQDVHLKIIHKSGSGKAKKKNPRRCNHIHIVVNRCPLRV